MAFLHFRTLILDYYALVERRNDSHISPFVTKFKYRQIPFSKFLNIFLHEVTPYAIYSSVSKWSAQGVQTFCTFKCLYKLSQTFSELIPNVFSICRYVSRLFLAIKFFVFPMTSGIHITRTIWTQYDISEKMSMSKLSISTKYGYLMTIIGRTFFSLFMHLLIDNLLVKLYFNVVQILSLDQIVILAMFKCAQ